MRVHNVHERVVTMPLSRVFSELEALGTPDDRIWPAPKIPFHRTEGPLKVGETTEKHGIIRASLSELEPNATIVWEARQSFIRGTHGFEVCAVDGDASKTLVRHALSAKVAWWFAPLWVAKMRQLHDHIIEALFDRLEQVDEARSEHLDQPHDVARREPALA